MSVRPTINNPGRVVAAYFLDEEGNPQVVTFKNGVVVDIASAHGVAMVGFDSEDRAQFLKVTEDGMLEVQNDIATTLEFILIQLKKMNIQLSIVTDNEFIDGEIE